jgi:radical SAM superfamily enzyme YgiQ (UPF0313 family)
VALVYPSPYRAAMSSLGFQTIYREINREPGCCAERAFLPDDPLAYRQSKEPLFCYESGRPVGDFCVVALSVAYELELAGLVEVLELSGIPPLAEERGKSHPLVLCGGPLTFSNPLPLAPFADAILVGEADQTIHQALRIIARGGDRAESLEALAREIDSCFVPSIHGDKIPPRARCDKSELPAYGPIRTAHTELKEMFLIEAVRGCSRGCAYCVMRNPGKKAMRIVPAKTILQLIPAEASRVGLVGAGVSDHPEIVDLLETLAAQGRHAGLSSLRPDRLDDRLVGALAKAGGRTLTTALDAASERLRARVGRQVKEEDLLKAASLARAHGYQRMKLYLMVGLPDEREEDLRELVAFARELARVHPLTLAIAPFVAKRNTPLDGAPFAGIKNIEERLRMVRDALGARVELRPTSARWAFVEYVLAQGGQREGRAVIDAVRRGGRFRDWKQAFKECGNGGCCE